MQWRPLPYNSLPHPVLGQGGSPGSWMNCGLPTPVCKALQGGHLTASAGYGFQSLHAQGQRQRIFSVSWVSTKHRQGLPRPHRWAEICLPLRMCNQAIFKQIWRSVLSVCCI